MQTTCHLSPAEDVPNIVESIISAYKSKAITINVEEDEDTLDLTDEEKYILDERLKEDKDTYLTASESINQLKSKYGV